MSLIGLRFWVISDRTWTWNAYLALALATMSFFLILFFQPESPRFLYSRKKFDKAEAALNKIYLVNKKKKVRFLFSDSRDSVALRAESVGTVDFFRNHDEARRNNLTESTCI
jgi:hypothetical protein